MIVEALWGEFPYTVFVKTAILVSVLGVGLFGCNGGVEQVQAMKLDEARTFSAIKLEERTGDTDAYGKLLKLVDGLSKDVIGAMSTSADQRVAGQKAILVAEGLEFEKAVRELVEGESWVIPTGLTPEMGFEERYEVVGDSFASHAKLKLAVKILDNYAEVVDEGGNPELAARAYLTARLLSQRVIEASPSLICEMVGVANSAITERGIREMALRGSWNSGDIQVLQGKGMTKFAAMTGLAGAIRNEWTNYSIPLVAEIPFPFERGGGAELFDGLDEKAVSFLKQNPNPYDRRLTLELGSKYIEITADEMEKTPMLSVQSDGYYREILGSVPTEVTDEKSKLEWFKSTPNAFGYVVLQLAFPTFGQARLAALRSEASRGLSEVVLAARRGMVETGDLPGSYSELKKFGLPEDIVDPFSGKAFGYDPVRGVAWSVGPDKKDDGGKDTPERVNSETKDYVVRLK